MAALNPDLVSPGLRNALLCPGIPKDLIYFFLKPNLSAISKYTSCCALANNLSPINVSPCAWKFPTILSLASKTNASAMSSSILFTFKNLLSAGSASVGGSDIMSSIISCGLAVLLFIFEFVVFLVLSPQLPTKKYPNGFLSVRFAGAAAPSVSSTNF